MGPKIFMEFQCGSRLHNSGAKGMGDGWLNQYRGTCLLSRNCTLDRWTPRSWAPPGESILCRPSRHCPARSSLAATSEVTSCNPPPSQPFRLGSPKIRTGKCQFHFWLILSLSMRVVNYSPASTEPLYRLPSRLQFPCTSHLPSWHLNEH